VYEEARNCSRRLDHIILSTTICWLSLLPGFEVKFYIFYSHRVQNPVIRRGTPCAHYFQTKVWVCMSRQYVDQPAHDNSQVDNREENLTGNRETGFSTSNHTRRTDTKGHVSRDRHLIIRKARLSVFDSSQMMERKS